MEPSLCALKTIYASKRQNHTGKPAWRVACMGLNIEAKCLNSHCEAFACRVRCQKGFGVFNVAEPVSCPICKMGALLATRIGLIGCQWMIEGYPIDLSIMPKSWRESSCEEYQRFGLDGGYNNNLIVTTKRLGSSHVRDMDMDVQYDAENCAESLGTLKLSASKL